MDSMGYIQSWFWQETPPTSSEVSTGISQKTPLAFYVLRQFLVQLPHLEPAVSESFTAHIGSMYLSYINLDSYNLVDFYGYSCT